MLQRSTFYGRPRSSTSMHENPVAIQATMQSPEQSRLEQMKATLIEFAERAKAMNSPLYFSKKDEDEGDKDAPKGFEKFFKKRTERKESASKSEESQENTEESGK